MRAAGWHVRTDDDFILADRRPIPCRCESTDAPFQGSRNVLFSSGRRGKTARGTSLVAGTLALPSRTATSLGGIGAPRPTLSIGKLLALVPGARVLLVRWRPQVFTGRFEEPLAYGGPLDELGVTMQLSMMRRVRTGTRRTREGISEAAAITRERSSTASFAFILVYLHHAVTQPHMDGTGAVGDVCTLAPFYGLPSWRALLGKCRPSPLSAVPLRQPTRSLLGCHYPQPRPRPHPPMTCRRPPPP